MSEAGVMTPVTIDLAGTSLRVRPLQADDVGDLTAFLQGLSATTRAWWNVRGDEAAAAQAHARAIGDPRTLRSVVLPEVVPATIVGLLEFSLEFPADAELSRFRDYGDPIVVDQDVRFGPCLADGWQGRGLGAALIPYVHGIARALGRRRIVLWGGVAARNVRAVAFYQRHGFRHVGEFTDAAGHRNIDMVADVPISRG